MIDISSVTAHGPHIGSFRTTKYEVREVLVGPNGIRVRCVERGVHGSAPVWLVVDESVYTPEQIATIHAFFSLVEEGFRLGHDAKEEELKLAGIDVPRAEVHKLVAEAEGAKAAKEAADLEALRIAAENIVKRADLEATEAAANLAEQRRSKTEEEIAEREAALAALDEQLKAMRAERTLALVALDAQLKAKRAEIAVTKGADGDG